MLAVSLLLVFLLIGGYCPFGNRSLAGLDANTQYLDFFAYLKDVLNGKQGISYDLSNTLGNSNLSLFAYYLSSPLNLLIVFFKKSQLAVFFDLLVVLKLSLAAITMAIFLRMRFEAKLRPVFTVLLSISYALMEFDVDQASNIMWLDGVYLLPLVLLGVWVIVREGKRWQLAVAVAATLIFNWYTGIINCLFTAFWLALELCLANDGQSIKWLVRKVIDYSSGMIIGVLLSAFLFLPNFYALVNGSRSQFDNSLLGIGFVGNPLILFGRLSIFSFSTNDASHTVLYCGSLVLLGFVASFFSGRLSKKTRLVIMIATIVVIMMYYWQPLYLLFSLFKKVESYWSRYSYLGIFFIIFGAAKFYSTANEKGLEQQAIWKGVCTLDLLILVGSWYISSLKNGLIMAIIVIVAGGLLSFVDKSAFRAQQMVILSSIACLSFIELGTNMVNGWEGAGNDAQKQSLYHRYVSHQEKQIASIKRGNYRIIQTNNRVGLSKNGLTANYNESLTYNYWSLAGYNSNQSSSQLSFLENLGYRSEGSRMTIVNEPLLGTDTLLGVKYLLASRGTVTTGWKKVSKKVLNGKTVYKNTYALPLAFTARSKASGVKLTGNPFENQNLLFSTLSGSNKKVYTPVSYKSKVAQNYLKYTLLNTNKKKPVYGNLTWQVSEAAQLFVNGHFKSAYTSWLSPSVFNIPVKSSSVTVTLSNVSNPMSISAQFYQLSLANLRSLSRAIKYKSDVRKINISKGKIQVLVVAKKKNECLYLTIPYDNGWKITNNGKRTSASQWLGGGDDCSPGKGNEPVDL